MFENLFGGKKKTVDVYNVVDADGNVVDTVKYEEGSTDYERSKANRDNGVESYVYKTNKEGDDAWHSTLDATVTTDIDPIGGIITVTGPKWLTSEVVESDTFKKNFSENSALLQTINLYRQDADATVQTSDGQMLSVQDVLGKYEEGASSYASSFAAIKAYKDTQLKKFGVNMSDADVSIASSFINKDDYDKNSVVYLPEWAFDNYDWSKLPSFDSAHSTLSAGDFFNTVYQEGFDNHVASKLQTEALERMKAALDNNVYDHDNEEVVNEKAEELGDPKYTTNLARTMQLYSIVTQNKPEMSAAYSAYEFTVSTINSLAAGALNMGLNLSEAVLQVNDYLTKTITVGEGGEEMAVGAYWKTLGPQAPIQTAAFFVGELLLAIGNINTEDGINDVIDNFLGDVDSYMKASYGNVLQQRHAELTSIKDAYDEKKRMLTDWWAKGEFVGYLGWKIVENLTMLNKIGGAVANATRVALTSKGFATVAGKVLGKRGVAMMANGLAATANVSAQAALETLFDDKQVIDKAIASGEMTDELKDILIGNFVGNAIAEIGMPALVKGSKAALEAAAEVSTAGKVAYLAVNKAVSGIAAAKHGAVATFFSMLNGVKPDADSLSRAIFEAEIGSSRRLALYNVATEFVRRDMASNIWNIPIFKSLSQEMEGVYRSSYSFVFGGERYLAAITAEEAQAAVKEGIEAALSDAEVAVSAGEKSVVSMANEAEEKAVAEAQEAEKAVQKAEASKSNIERNYELMKQQILLRANLENQLDSISKGAQMMFDKMKTYAGKDFTDLRDNQYKTLEMEQNFEKTSGKTLHRWKEGGTVLSKESSEYLSLKTQHGRYAWMVEQAERAGSWKYALNSEGNRLFKSNSEYQAIKEKAEAYAKRIGEMTEYLGEDLVKSLDALHISAGRFHTRIMEFMGRNGYIDKEEYALFKRLARNQGWGKDGELYLPTNRVSGKDAEYGFSSTNAWLSDPNNKPTRKMVSGGLERLSAEATEGEFGDPIANLMVWTSVQAKVAQSQSLGRALFAVSVPMRAVKGYDANGLTKEEASIVEKSVKELETEFQNAFRGDRLGNAYSKALFEAEETGNVFEEGLKRYKAGDTKPLEKARAAMVKKSNEVRRRIEKNLLNVDLPGVNGIQTTLINDADSAAIDDVLAKMYGEKPLPIFNPANIPEGTGDFNRWFDSLSDQAQLGIIGRLNGQEITRENVIKLAEADPDFELKLKRNTLQNASKKMKKTEAYKNFILDQYKASDLFKQGTTLADDVKTYTNLMEGLEKNAQKTAGYETKLDPKSSETYGEFFMNQINELTTKTVTELVEIMKSNTAFQEVIKAFEEAGASPEMVEAAERYIVLEMLSKKSTTQLTEPFLKGKVASVRGAKTMSGYGVRHAKQEVLQSIGRGLKHNIETELNKVRSMLVDNGYGNLMNMNGYFESVQKHMDEITSKYGFTEGQKVGTSLNDSQRRKIVELIDKDGNFKYYETDPLYASLANEPTAYFTDKGANIIGGLNHTINTIFRFGTTGIDTKSYINQWFRDPINAVIVGGYRPFVDLRAGGFKSKLASMYYDLGLPFGAKIFGKYATTELTDQFVEYTYKATREGMVQMFGEEFVANFEKEAAGDLVGKDAEMAVKRAMAQYAVGDLGYNQLAGLGGITSKEFYRISPKSGEVEEFTPYKLSSERAEVVFGSKGNIKDYQILSGKFNDFLSDRVENLTRGGFREEFLRKGVYASQYRAAVMSGMTYEEADVWATRYALDATTNFNRTFMYGNDFIKSVPYLGAAINGMKSFWRLLEMDPIGIMKRFVFGLAMPYARMLALSLSSEENREAYKNIREYEKEDNLVFVWKGEVISFPAPQELSSFLAPFRHFIEKAADVQDHSWLELTTSDALGLLPLDLSGFVDLDANVFLADGRENGLGSRIGRGVEKAASSLMGPISKSAYMAVTGRDPYTGREIDTSYTRVNADGDIEIMDSTQSDLAKLIHEKFPDVSASAANKILQSLFGRSTLTVLDGAYSILNGSFDVNKVLNEQIDAAMSPFEAATYNAAKTDWNRAVSIAYDMREQLVNDETFQKAYQVARDKNYSEEKRTEAKRTYNEMLDKYSQFVLNMAKQMKARYPTQYTNDRMASVLSLLTLPTGLTLGETEYADQVQQDAYFNARNSAVETFLKMGFPSDVAGNTALGTGYYDKYGKFQYKIYTPYEIESLNSTVYGTSDRVQASIESAIKAADINKSDMWAGYYEAGTKAERKAYKEEWNSQVVHALYPVISRYGVKTVLNSSDTVDLLDNYIFVDNPYKTKQYLNEIFGGDE